MTNQEILEDGAVDVPITYYDLELLQEMLDNNEVISWVLDDINNNGRQIKLIFMSEDEEQARRGM